VGELPSSRFGFQISRDGVRSGVRNEEQLRQNLGAVGWSLTAEQVTRLDAASEVTAPNPYSPYRRQEGFARLNPPPV
jgi:hypothetical protein